MTNIVHAIKRAAGRALALDTIPRGIRWFMLTQFGYMLFTTIPGVFINTFFFRQDGRFSTVAFYNAIVVYVLALTMHIATVLAIKKSPVVSLRAGIVFSNVFYLALLILQQDAVRYMPLLGVLNGFSQGFYWLGYNTLFGTLNGEEGLDRVLGLMSAIGAVVNLTVPALSGLVITFSGGSLGYTLIFLLSFLLSMVTTWLSTRIPSRKSSGGGGLLVTYAKLFTHKSSALMLMCDLFRGFRDISFALFLNIVFFKYVDSEALLGLSNTVCGLVSVVALLTYSRLLSYKNRAKSVVISALALTVVNLLLFIRVDAVILFILTVVNAFAVNFISLPLMASFYAKFRTPVSNLNFTNIVAIRELIFATGRVLGLLLLVVFIKWSVSGSLTLLILNLTVFPAVLMLVLSQRAEKHESSAKTDAAS